MTAVPLTLEARERAAHEAAHQQRLEDMLEMAGVDLDDLIGALSRHGRQYVAAYASWVLLGRPLRDQPARPAELTVGAAKLLREIVLEAGAAQSRLTAFDLDRQHLARSPA